MGYLREMEIDAPLDRVWRAFTDEGELEHWFCERAHLEPVPGGAFECYWGPDATQGTAGCHVLEVEPERHVRFEFRPGGSFAGMFPPQTTRPVPIDVTFTPRDAGHTTVAVEEPETREVEGWAAYDEWAADAWEEALIGLKQHCEEGTTSVVSREAFVH